jgi:hypothetical protein
MQEDVMLGNPILQEHLSYRMTFRRNRRALSQVWWGADQYLVVIPVVHFLL